VLKPRGVALLVILAACAAAGFLSIQRRQTTETEATNQRLDVIPAGRWNRVQRLTDDPEEMARVLSLPYTSGSQPAPGQTGVVAHDTARTQPGANLYVSGHDPEAILMDNGGRVLHRWEYPFEQAFPDRSTTVETGFFRRVALLENGDLIALYQGGGLVRIDRQSKPLWSAGHGFYNDFSVDADGRIAAIGKSAREVPNSQPQAFYLEDFIQWLDADGKPDGRASLLAAFQNSEFSELLQPLGATGDILHSNTITLLDGSSADRSPIFAAGNYLVSLREVDVIGILDPSGTEVLWAQKGPWDAQHEPVVLEGGKILVFDNQGAEGTTRIYEFDPLTGGVTWDYRGPEGRPLDSPEAGSVQRLANGNTLITESEQGRALEVDEEGNIVWEFVSPHRAGEQGELVATLFEVVRLPRESAGFLRSRPKQYATGSETDDASD